MTCRYEKGEIKREKDRENVQNIIKSQEDMIKSKTNPKDIKNIKKEDFYHQAQVHCNNYKKGSSQAEKKDHRTPSRSGSIYSLSFTPLIPSVLISHPL